MIEPAVEAQIRHLLGNIPGESLLEAVQRRLGHLHEAMDDLNTIQAVLGRHVRTGDTVVGAVRRLISGTGEVDLPPEEIGDLTPLDVLDQDVVPRLFTAHTGIGQLVLVYLSAERTDGELYIVAPTNPRALHELVHGEIYLRQALTSSWLWVVHRGRDGILEGAVRSETNLPPDCTLPSSTVLLPMLGDQKKYTWDRVELLRDRAALRLVCLNLHCSAGEGPKAAQELQAIIRGVQGALADANGVEPDSRALVNAIYKRAQELKDARGAHGATRADLDAVMDALKLPPQVSASRWAKALVEENQDMAAQLVRHRIRLRALGLSE